MSDQREDTTPDDTTPDDTIPDDTIPDDTIPDEAQADGSEVTSLMPAVSDDPADEAPREGAGAKFRRTFFAASRSQVIVGVLLALVGYAVVIQVRSTEEDSTYEGRRQEDLIQIFNGLTGNEDRTRREIDRLDKARRDLLVDTSAREAAVEQARQRVDALNILAGHVPVTGPGLRVTIIGEQGVSLSLLLDMVQELRTAGAEAMEFNDSVRLVASSHFDVDGAGNVSLDGTALGSPYVLEAIGESATLHAGLDFPSGPIRELEKIAGVSVDVEELSRVDITSTVDEDRPVYAEPSAGQ
ncbi:DUF881 domain-containing protein [Nocardioides yefusunii]|uniref:DUF881 domain-containing protein n=1 Tax=Nocardioides yefusunii TaxID=2500546 RepID=A0ABW1QUW8_9ACTN|nr:DUF881 domain-containing protein [Nocardioides yefusunii]